MSDPDFFAEIAHKAVRIEKMLRKAEAKAVLGHMLEGEVGRIECSGAEKALRGWDWMAGFGTEIRLVLLVGDVRGWGLLRSFLRFECKISLLV
jgi:hypothetical protein